MFPDSFPSKDEIPLFEDYLNSAFPCEELYLNEDKKLSVDSTSPLLRTYSNERSPSSPESSRSSSSKEGSVNEVDSDISTAIQLSNALTQHDQGNTLNVTSGRSPLQDTQILPEDITKVQVCELDQPHHLTTVASGQVSKYQLNLHGIPAKSRVETQIRLGLQLVQVSDGPAVQEVAIGDRYQWLKLPSWAMAKEKLKLQNRRDAPSTIDPNRIIFLDARVVKSTDPHGDVTICPGCVIRERKRAQRKKDPPKRISENKLSLNANSQARSEVPELQPLPDEEKKILVFNCPELLEVTNGEVVIPTRVTCYCRHHKEKDGFRIVITLRDAANNILASTSSDLVLITDDHKTTGKVQRAKDQITSSVKGQPYLVQPGVASSPQPSGVLDPSRSSSGVVPLPRPESTRGASRRSSISSTTTSRKRKAESASSSIFAPVIPKLQKVPSSLSMTNLVPHRDSGSQASRASVTTRPSSPALTRQSFARSPSEDSLHRYSTGFKQAPASNVPQLSSNQSIGMANSYSSPDNTFFDASMDEVMQNRNLSLSPRARTWDYIMDHATQNEYAEQNNLIMPPISNQHTSLDIPRISRMIPAEGPLQGGTEVTILGNGFRPGMTALFGESPAVPTHCWSSTTIVCVLPQATNAGPVPVTLKEHPYSIGAKMFTYIDETDRALYELALQVIGLKTTGRLETARDVAMRICSSKMPSETVDKSLGTMSMQQLRTALGFSETCVDTEELIRGCLLYLDTIENGRVTRLSQRSKTGHTLLHLAVMQGYTKLIEDLLQRGANANSRDHSSFTSLHIAALHGHIEAAEILLDLGQADIRRRTCDGRGPYDIAAFSDGNDLTSLLDDWSEADCAPQMRFRSSSRSRSIVSQSSSNGHRSGSNSRRSSAASDFEVPALPMRNTRRISHNRSQGIQTQPVSRENSPHRKFSSIAKPKLRQRSKSVDHMPSSRAELSQSLRSEKYEMSADIEKDTHASVNDTTETQNMVNNLIQLQHSCMAFLSETSPLWLQKTLANANASLPGVLKNTANLPQNIHLSSSPIAVFQAMLPSAYLRSNMRLPNTVRNALENNGNADSNWFQNLVASLGAPPSYAEATTKPVELSPPSLELIADKRESTHSANESSARIDEAFSPQGTSRAQSLRHGVRERRTSTTPFRSQGRIAEMTPEQQRDQVKRLQKPADRMMFIFWLPCLLFFIMISFGKAVLGRLFGIAS